MAKFLSEVDFPVLAANLDLDAEPELAFNSILMPSKVFEVGADKVRVGIIGYLTPETKAVAVGNNVEFIDEIVSLK